VRGGDQRVGRSNLLKEAVPGLPRGILDAAPLGGCQGGDIRPTKLAGETQANGGGSNELGVARRVRPQRVVKVGNRQPPTAFRGKPRGAVQQRHGIGTAGDGKQQVLPIRDTERIGAAGNGSRQCRGFLVG
jgi:hypothetical protein